MEQLSLFDGYTNCEACWFFFKMERPATKEMGWDLAPVCDWHATRSWVSSPKCGQVKKVEVVVEKICENVIPCPDHRGN